MKKGFTLIELLAVIVILAIIALIAVPLIINMIEESRQKTAVISGRNYIKAVNYKIAQEALNDKITPLGEYVIGENELKVSADNIENITGSYEIGEKGVLTAGLCVNKYSVEYSSGKAYIKKDVNYCSGGYTFEEPEATLLSTLCEGENADNVYSNNTKFKIKTVEDLACLSNTVNSGKNFSGKEIYLLSDLNISSASSYKSSTTTKYGDINGDGNTEGLLTELTTGKGFRPIGSSSKKYSGTFLGYAYTISNLMINRPSESNVGLFGYSTGTIKGIRLEGANITGSSNVGGILGYYYGGTIKDLDVKGNITAINSYAGGIVGNRNDAVSLTNVIFSGNVTGSNYVAGLIGYNNKYRGTTSGVVYNSTIEQTATDIKAYIAKADTASDMTGTVRTSNVTIIKHAAESYDGTNGGAYKAEDSGILVFDDAVDTYIGGDNDSDGYYFDYDSTGNIKLYSTERTPIQNKLKGEGTQETPYLIRNTNDWRMASALVTQNNYYSVTNDIDFAGKPYYPLGTANNSFSGNLNGNMHTLSNITVGGYSNVGVFGKNTGTIEGFNFVNTTVSSSASNVGGVVGYSGGITKGISSTNLTINSTGSNVGGAVGYYYSGTLKSFNIKGSITSTGSYVGGIIGGRNDAVSIYSSVFEGSVKGYNYVGGLVSCNNKYRGSTSGVVYNTTVEETATDIKPNIGKGDGCTDITGTIRNSNVQLIIHTAEASTGTSGGTFNASDKGILVFDDAVDTYIGGDNDNDGYYFDYDSNGDIILYAVGTTPIRNTLSGEGTQESPYLIKNTDDWKMASALGTSSKYFVVTNDIDFANKKFYPLGTNSNVFNGNINGNMHTISNITIGGHNNVGVFGKISGTVEGLKFNNTHISATASNVGGVVGYSSGVVKGISSTNLTINSTGSNVGGVVGYYNSGSLRNLNVTGNITSTGSYVGGIVGNRNDAVGVYSSAFSGNIKAYNYAGGLVACNNRYRGSTSGVVYNSTIETTVTTEKAYLGKVDGCTSISGTMRNYNVTITPKSNDNYSTGTSGTTISELTIANISGAVDTTNTNVYYFIIANSNLDIAK